MKLKFVVMAYTVRLGATFICRDTRAEFTTYDQAREYIARQAIGVLTSFVLTVEGTPEFFPSQATLTTARAAFMSFIHDGDV